MPWRTTWAEPPVAVRHKGVKVYHTYRHDDADDVQSEYWFTLDPDSDENQFDVRDLKNWSRPEEYNDLMDCIRSVLKEAIELGYLKKREED